MSPQFQISLGAQACLEQTGDGFHISTPAQEFRLRAPEPALASALGRLANGGATEDALCEEVLLSGEASALFSLLGILRTLDSGGALQRRVLVEGRPFATLIPTAAGFQFNAGLIAGPRKLSRFAYLHSDDGSLRIESPLGRARLELQDPRATAITALLAQTRSLHDLEEHFPDLAGGPLEGLLILLENAAVLTEAGDSAEGWWEFHDLLFHMRSRRGRHDHPYGGTYRHKIAAPPLIKPRAAGETIPLPRPDLDQLRRSDPPFTDVLERRRSIRAYAPEPITIEQLGEFLYRSARYQKVLGDQTTSYALTPAPAGGALHELELYPVVARCRGLDPGVYHYRRAEHELTRIAEPSPLFDNLLEQAWTTANRESPLNVLLQVTARCQRVFWKYESMAYALILKNLGALYATMYLTATAMDLAPCALGGGDSELFATLAGLDPCEEPAVGEFILGSRA